MIKYDKNKDRLKLFLSQDGELIPDVLGKLPENGFCIKFDKNELKKLVHEKFKMLDNNEIAQRYRKIQKIIILQIKKKILSRLSLAKKSGTEKNKRVISAKYS